MLAQLVNLGPPLPSLGHIIIYGMKRSRPRANALMNIYRYIYRDICIYHTMFIRIDTLFFIFISILLFLWKALQAHHFARSQNLVSDKNCNADLIHSVGKNPCAIVVKLILLLRNMEIVPKWPMSNGINMKMNEITKNRIWSFRRQLCVFLFDANDRQGLEWMMTLITLYNGMTSMFSEDYSNY